MNIITYYKMCGLTRNQLVHKIIDYVPTEKIKFSNLEWTGELKVFFTIKRVLISIVEDNTWDEIKRHIDVKLSDKKDKDCSICDNTFAGKIGRVTCNKCAGEYCSNCYINIFRIGKGIMPCPFCRDTIGVEHPDYLIEPLIEKLRNTLETNSCFHY